MKMRRRAAAIGAWLALCALPAASAVASVYDFTLSGSGYTASGTITIASDHPYPATYPCAICVSGPGYAVTNIAGTINGQAITGVAPVNSVAGNDNLLYLTAPYLDWGDLGFTTAAASYNVFNDSFKGRNVDFLAVGGGSVYANPVQFSITSAVPESGEWALMLAGLGLTAMTLRTRRARD